ncbi:LOW QUALITY PROTEIN: uncharacterized protein O8D03_012625 [Erethizon dorsatum]
MGRRNSTSVPDFILMGLADSEEMQLVLFLLFLLIYLVTVLGNAGMILIIRLDHQLHTPMYFFLTHLSFLDLNYSSVITPKTLQNLLTSTKSISFLGCFIQMNLFALLGSTECFLLSSMAYDRYVAICKPLLYPVVMSTRLCRALVTGSYVFGFMDSTVNAVCMSRLHFCSSHVIHHFFCDTSPILALSCNDTYEVEITIFTFAGSTLVLSLITISGSYVSILSTILKINSTAGKKKAFSTCASHLLGVTIFYSTMIFTYLKPKESSLGKDQVASVFYTIVIPMLNPLIYSLRNKEVKNAVIRVLQKRQGSRQLISVVFSSPWMEEHNLTVVTEFILLGVTDRPELQAPLFVLFLTVYLTSLVGNLGMIVLTQVDSRLQTPMYFFLRHLALTDLGYSTAVGLKMLVNFVVDENTISYYGCATQLAFVFMCLASELFILSAMSYDRYVAICNPLLYTVIMSQRVCWVLVAIPYLYCTFVSLLVTIKIFTLSFCGHNVISHFYCDSLPLLSLLCSDTHEIEVIILILAAFNLISSLLVVLMSYLLIFVAILRMNSVEGRCKAFSTCGSHLTVVTVFYGTLIFMYVQPKSSHSFDTDKVASVFYTVIIPMLNPLIYSLRNKDVKCALQQKWKKINTIFS